MNVDHCKPGLLYCLLVIIQLMMMLMMTDCCHVDDDINSIKLRTEDDFVCNSQYDAGTLDLHCVPNVLFHFYQHLYNT